MPHSGFLGSWRRAHATFDHLSRVNKARGVSKMRITKVEAHPCPTCHVLENLHTIVSFIENPWLINILQPGCWVEFDQLPNSINYIGHSTENSFNFFKKLGWLSKSKMPSLCQKRWITATMTWRSIGVPPPPLEIWVIYVQNASGQASRLYQKTHV